MRPHHRFGTVEVRICDGQTDLRDGLALCALMLGLIAEFCAEVDEGRPHPVYPRGLIEENLWRAERHGVEGSLIDLRTGHSRPARVAIGELLELADTHATRLGLSPWLARVATILEEGNGAMRQRRLLAEHGGDLRAVHAEARWRSRAHRPSRCSTNSAAARPPDARPRCWDTHRTVPAARPGGPRASIPAAPGGDGTAGIGLGTTCRP